MARYRQTFKYRTVAKLLPPQMAPIEEVARDVGISVGTLENCRAQALAKPVTDHPWTAAVRLDAMISTAALDETARGAWCREHGVFPQQRQLCRYSATQALALTEAMRVSPQQSRQEQRRIRELERELRGKDKVLAETAVLLVL